jgi:hypothetical protein
MIIGLNLIHVILHVISPDVQVKGKASLGTPPMGRIDVRRKVPGGIFIAASNGHIVTPAPDMIPKSLDERGIEVKEGNGQVHAFYNHRFMTPMWFCVSHKGVHICSALFQNIGQG